MARSSKILFAAILALAAVGETARHINGSPAMENTASVADLTAQPKNTKITRDSDEEIWTNFRHKVYRARETMMDELEKEKERKPWEAVYSTGSPFLLRGIIVTEHAYVTTGRSGHDMGRVRANKGSLEFISDAPLLKPGMKKSFSMFVVPWDERLYLIQPDYMVHFCNHVNSGEGRCPGAGHSFYRRLSDFEKQAAGLPDVPHEYSDYLLATPITARIIKISAKKQNVKLPGEKETMAETVAGIPLTINKGKRHGVKAGMEFYPSKVGLFPTATVHSVAEATSELILQGDTRSGLFDEDMALSTRNPNWDEENE